MSASVRRIVVTGGPGAGKTAALELARQTYCARVRILPEAASILFSGGFPRGSSLAARAAAQRAIFHVQRELEAAAEAEEGPPILVCDRGTVDGAAYWPGPDEFWAAVGTTRAAEHARYDTVIHLATPSLAQGYNHQNPVRVESAAVAAAIDRRITLAWEGHPHRHFVPSAPDFLDKVHRVLDLLRAELPDVCTSLAGSA